MICHSLKMGLGLYFSHFTYIKCQSFPLNSHLCLVFNKNLDVLANLQCHDIVLAYICIITQSLFVFTLLNFQDLLSHFNVGYFCVLNAISLGVASALKFVWCYDYLCIICSRRIFGPTSAQLWSLWFLGIILEVSLPLRGCVYIHNLHVLRSTRLVMNFQSLNWIFLIKPQTKDS